jgi:biotin operon repressor
MLQNSKSIEERNYIIYKANQEGFSQHKLAVIVGISQTQINRIIKQLRN